VEKYLSNSLDSLVNQSFQDFEAIIINDGSTDNTQNIIDEYCNKYPNFKSIIQENQGVAVARNNGINIAKGDYIGFLDADGDYYLNESLENFNNTIKYHNSLGNFPDLIIGRQTMVDPWIKHSYKNAKQLSNLEDINPYDERILWTMSLINKMFSRKKIIESGLKMPLLSHASDASFVLPFIYSCEKIVGCPHEFLIYKKRLFFDKYSLSQDSSLETIEDYYKSYEIILESFEDNINKIKNSLKNQKKYNELKEYEMKHLKYEDSLIYREAVVLFIDQVYRFFWRTNMEIIKRTKEILDSFKPKMFPSTWEKLVNNNKDLDLNNLITNPKELAENPIITIVINNFQKKELTRIVSNIYNFHFPRFEVILSESSWNDLDEIFQNKENLSKIEYCNVSDFKNKALKVAKGDYIQFIDEDVFMSPKLLKQMFNKISKGKYDFILGKMTCLIEEDFSKQNYEINEFSKENIISSNKEYDYSFSNKLIKTDFLKKNNFFSKNSNNDIKKLYELGKYSKLLGNYILTNDSYIKDPFISVIIDDININKEDLNLLLDSIYSQGFKSFDLIINENLKELINDSYKNSTNENLKKLNNSYKTNTKENLKELTNNSYKTNIRFLKDKNFKKIAIENSKSKYGIFIDVPIIYKDSTFEKLFFKAEKYRKELELEKNNLNKDNFSFVSTPIYQYKIRKNSKSQKAEVKTKDIKSLKSLKKDKIETKYFTSQELIYSHKNILNPSNKSKFMVFDLYLSNKLINLKYLKEKHVYFNENKNEDILYLYKNTKILKFREKLVLSKLSQKKLIDSIYDKKSYVAIKLLYKIHKIIFIAFSIRRALKNGAK
jgi:glycosyltransferase involved in cell wall biosynthesis